MTTNMIEQPMVPAQNGTGQKTQKTMSIQEYTKELEKMHRVRKLESEIAEFEFRGYMAKMQLNQQLYLQEQARLKAEAGDQPTTGGEDTPQGVDNQEAELELAKAQPGFQMKSVD